MHPGQEEYHRPEQREIKITLGCPGPDAFHVSKTKMSPQPDIHRDKTGKRWTDFQLRWGEIVGQGQKEEEGGIGELLGCLRTTA